MREPHNEEDEEAEDHGEGAPIATGAPDEGDAQADDNKP